jgi:hypothetical protein
LHKTTRRHRSDGEQARITARIDDIRLVDRPLVDG